MATKMTREEAINKVRQMNLPKETMEILEALAPELAESEDERIRKHLIEIVETYWGKTNEPGKAADLAWLEKQKEQKKEKFPPYVTGFKGHPDPAGTSDLEEAAARYERENRQSILSSVDIVDAFIAGAEWQKEQKPAECKGYKDAEKRYNESVAYHYPDSIPPGIAYKSPKCYTDVMIIPNTQSGTSTLKAEG